MQLRREIDDKVGEGKKLIQMSITYCLLGEYTQGMENAESAKIAQSTENLSLIAASLMEMGIINYRLSQYPQVLDSYQQTLAVSRKNSDRFGEATTLNNLGLVYDSLGHQIEALDSYQQALGIFR